MDRSARDLIHRALRNIGAYRFREVIEGDVAVEALAILNDFLASLAGSPLRIPYFTTLQFDLVPQKSVYTVGLGEGYDINTRKIVQVQSCKALLGAAEFQITPRASEYYDRSLTLTSVFSRPKNVFLQNNAEGSMLTFYPAPNIAYPCTLKVKQVYDNVELDDRLNEMPNAMFMYVSYELGTLLAPGFGVPIDAQYLRTLNDARRAVEAMADKMPVSMSPSQGGRLTPYERAESGI